MVDTLRTGFQALILAGVATAGCSDGVVGPSSGRPEIEIDIQGLAPLHATTDGTYEVWVVDTAGAVLSAGRFAFQGEDAITVASPLEDPANIMVTVEPPGDDDRTPSLVKLLGGKFGANGEAELDVTGYVTPVGIPLETAPGVHVLSTASGRANDAGLAAAGLWLIDARVDSTDASFFQTFTQLTKGWTYEGWVVRDRGSPDAVWLSYGQFLPNNIRKARFRDDTGIGPFSGFVDYERAMPGEIHYPGDDWIANPGAYPVPGAISLPLDLNGYAAAGEASRWTHVITIEPRHEPDGVRTELPWEATPFFLQPYGNVIGEAAPEQPRTIGFVPGSLPRGTARILRPADS
jgi:hypothetical protein